MAAGKTIAKIGLRQDSQLTGWPVPARTGTSPNELPYRAATPTALLNRPSLVICSLADPRPPPTDIPWKRQGLFKVVLPWDPAANPVPNYYDEAYRHRFTLPARSAGVMLADFPLLPLFLS